jgi:hypothetical protein
MRSVALSDTLARRVNASLNSPSRERLISLARLPACGRCSTGRLEMFLK